MTPRARWQAVLRLEPLDHLPFWAKLNASYPSAQAAPFDGMTLPELHEWMGSEEHAWFGGGVREKHTRTDYRVTTADGVQRFEYVTPHGTLHRTDVFDTASQSWHPREFPIRTRDDIVAMASWFADVTVEADTEAQERITAAVAQSRFCTATSIGTSPLMDVLQHLAGIDQGQYLLADYPDEIGELFAAMHRVLMARAEIVCAGTPGDLVYLVENTSTTLVSPEQFRRYCLPYLSEYAAVARAHGRQLGLHMCGHLKALLPDLDTLPVTAFEAFTSPTVGNTTLLDGRTGCPGKCLIGGTNAAIWTRPARDIIAHLQQQLEELPHHRGLILSSAGVMPPAATPETIKTVVEWIGEYKARW